MKHIFVGLAYASPYTSLLSPSLLPYRSCLPLFQHIGETLCIGHPAYYLVYSVICFIDRTSVVAPVRDKVAARLLGGAKLAQRRDSV